MSYALPAARALEALADPTRRAIVERLRGGPVSVGAIADGLPISRPAVSQHLRVLGAAGIVRHDIEGTRHLYSLRGDGFAALRDYLDLLWDDALHSFATHVRKTENGQ